MPADHIRGSRYMCPMGAGFISVVLYSVDVTLVLGDHTATVARAPLPCGLPKLFVGHVPPSQGFFMPLHALCMEGRLFYPLPYFPRDDRTRNAPRCDL